MSLVIISITVSAALVFVHMKTQGPIEAASKMKEINAIREVVPDFDSDPLLNRTEKDGVVIYSLTKENKPAGYAVKTYTEKGFAGHIEIMAGFLPDGTIYKTVVLSHKETPGLGNKIAEPKFQDQFPGKNPEKFNLKVKKDNGDVDAITAATISSRAYCDAIQRAYDHFKVLSDSLSAQQNE